LMCLPVMIHMATVVPQSTGKGDIDRGSQDAESRLATLVAALRTRWTRDTSADQQHWSPENPSYGQCAVTSLIVQDILGGSLLRARVKGTTHYWNRLPSGEELDLTREQFGAVTDIPTGEERPRDYVLSFPDTARRYHALAESVREALASC
jgi:hypothetical protein